MVFEKLIQSFRTLLRREPQKETQREAQREIPEWQKETTFSKPEVALATATAPAPIPPQRENVNQNFPSPPPPPPSSSAPGSSTPGSKPYVYFPAPPIISTIHQYQDVNNDKNLQNKVTLYFLEKTIECIKYDESWKSLKRVGKHLKGKDGYEIMHKLLKLFVRRGNTNWYDLRVQEELVLNFIKHKLSQV